MKLLTFQAGRFTWSTHQKSLPDFPDLDEHGEVTDAVVAFLHIEEGDTHDRDRIFKHTLKHLKWVAGKRPTRKVVLHSFTHLGGINAPPDFACALIDALAERLRDTGYEVWTTPFGHFCAWDIAVHGDSMAKVWKEIAPRSPSDAG